MTFLKGAYLKIQLKKKNKIHVPEDEINKDYDDKKYYKHLY